MSFFLTKISNKCVIIQPLKPLLTGEKEEKTEIEKFEYLDNEKRFLDEIKNIFHSF